MNLKTQTQNPHKGDIEKGLTAGVEACWDLDVLRVGATSVHESKCESGREVGGPSVKGYWDMTERARSGIGGIGNLAFRHVPC